MLKITKSFNKFFFSITVFYILSNNVYISAMIPATPVTQALGNTATNIAASAMASNAASSIGSIINNMATRKIINNIIIQGNTLVPTDTLLIKIPYRTGQVFDPALTGQLIKNLYGLKYFDSIQVEVENLPENYINLIINLKEKKKLESISYEGNSNLNIEEIEKKYKFSEIPAINQEEALLLAEQIKRLYQEKNYHNVNIKTELEITENNTILVKFNIEEGKKATVKRVNFQGNKAFNGKKLRSMIFTREDWILGAFDKAGTYDPIMVERDKQILENFYQSNGYFTARVIDVKTDINPNTQEMDITFIIDEGEIYTIGDISVDTHDKIDKEILLAALPVRPGQPYNKDLLRQSIEVLRTVWGQFGYAYADIAPRPMADFENKLIDIKFDTELGNQIFVDRINIEGNEKTRDWVIRRKLAINEGELITPQALDISKARVESLGYFDPQDGVNWKINKISDNLAELNLMVKEIRTGKLYGQVGFGGADDKSPASALKVSAGISDRNFMGTGIKYTFNLTFSQEDRGLLFNIYQPHLTLPWFNTPVGAGFDAYVRKSLYDEFKNVADIPVENVTGLIGNLTFSPLFMPNLSTIVNAGIERIHYNNKVIVEVPGQNQTERDLFQSIVNRRFEDGTVHWLGFITGQDLRNHPVYPSKGYNWSLSSKFCYPVPTSNFSFFKVDLDATWLTPLIGDSDLIFLLHGHAGFAKPLAGKNIPYRELYHVGGPATVRGYLYGQIGPQVFGDSIGAQKALWINAELIFAATKDQSLRGVLFYDGGAAWDTPSGAKFRELGLQDMLKNNRFNYRHSIGFGIRLASPPIRIDWGFKLDRNKRINEPASEVHFNMAQDF